VTERAPYLVRLELARGHWSLGEHDAAVSCLERAAEDDLARLQVLGLVEELLRETSIPKLEALRDELAGAELQTAVASPLNTGTMATLLAEQGYESQALRVANEALRRNPEDERAAAVRTRVAGNSDDAADSEGAGNGALRGADAAKRDDDPGAADPVDVLGAWLQTIRNRGSRGVHA